MDRRLFLTGLLGVAGTAALAAALPNPAGAATGDPLEDLRPPRPDDMPEWEVAEAPVDEGEQYAWHHGHPHHHRRRRRRRYRRWRRRCWWRYGRRICRRAPYFIWGWY
ncbi:protamine-2 (modular protein) [Terrihabitans soli]|uniref:protamine-2 (modular protein) n=1 Tax=Terrihabitans soli TaxID=708113 RepID=UPI001CA36122|nr:protamine-2 (modular protein) [Terrihabitans soli]